MSQQLTRKNSSSSGQDIEQTLESGQNPHPAHDFVLSDSEQEDEFIQKYGEINVQYIKKPADSFWFVKPHALNYFKDGILYRTKGERTSGKVELFLDLLYVGIVANLAEDATEHASAASFLKYILLFVPTWTVWCDIKDFVNYYYSEDLSQKLYILWILVLLVVYDNNCTSILEGRTEAAMTVVSYILCRVSLAISLLFYSIWVSEHRFQMRTHAICIFISSCVWIPVIFVSTRAKIGVSIAAIFLEQLSFTLIYHPWVKKNVFHLTVSTALNIEHEVERFGAFFIIAIGEFLYKTVAGNPVGPGFTSRLSRGVCLLIISFCLLWIYFNAGTSVKATHPLRRSGTGAIAFIYAHIPLIAGLILAADSAGEWITLEETSTAKHPHKKSSESSESSEGSETLENAEKVASFLVKRAIHHGANAANTFLKRAAEESESSSSEEEEHPSMYALSFFFTGGICISLLSMGLMAFAEKSRDPVNLHLVTKIYRVAPRFFAAIIILCLSFAEMSSTKVLAFTSMICVVLFLWESVMMTPRKSLPKHLGACHGPLSDVIERF